MTSFSSGEGEEFIQHLAHASTSQIPIAAGLRAAASEASSFRVSRALWRVAGEVERGRDATEVLADPQLRIPAHVRGLIAAANRSGRLGPALEELIEHHQRLRSMFWSILGSLAYPLIVLLAAILILGFFLVFVVPTFEDLFQTMQLNLPFMTQSLLQASKTIHRLVLGTEKWGLFVFAVLGLLAICLVCSGRGGGTLQRLLEMMPIIGPLWLWAGASGFMELLATLLDQDVPLDEALQCAAEGTSRANLRNAGAQLAEGVRSGQSLADLVESLQCLPATAVPVLRWGERAGALNEAARILAQMFADRVHARTVWLRSASPPIVYLFVVGLVGFAVTCLFLPLVVLIQSLGF